MLQQTFTIVNCYILETNGLIETLQISRQPCLALVILVAQLALTTDRCHCTDVLHQSICSK